MRIAAIISALACLTLHAGDKPAPGAARAVFIVSGLECGSCVYMVQNQLSHTNGIAEVEVLQGVEGYARVNYDPKLISEHQIAQAVREAPGLHGTPYIATLKLRVPGYSQKAPRVKALFEQWKPTVEMEVWDEKQGDLIVYFEELKKDPKGALPRGWSLAELSKNMKTLGLTFEIRTPEGF
jgi:copper chaperone CopZ